MCEDGIVATTDFVAVIDGSTSKAARQMRPDMRNGRHAMMLVSQLLSQMPATVTMEECCHLVATAIMEAYHQYGVEKSCLVDHPEERLTASAAIFSRHHGEVWLVGDCQCLVDGVYYDNPKPEEGHIAQERSEIIRSMLAHGVTDVASLQRHDKGRDLIVQKIVRTCHDQNKSFAVFDGFCVATEKVRVVRIPSSCEVVLATDGYPFLCPTLAESESRLDEQRRNDPLNIGRFKATKGFTPGNNSFDDRTYIRFMV